MEAFKILFSCYAIGYPAIACFLCWKKYRRENQPHILFLKGIRREGVRDKINLRIRRAH